MSGFTFVKDRGLHHGIPARDLTKDEYEALEPGQQRIVRESPSYKVVEATPTATGTPKSEPVANKTRKDR
jgi:hypothetical protein